MNLRNFSLIAVASLVLCGCATTPAKHTSEQSLTDGQSRFASVGTNRVYYFSVGSGKHTVVLVHCWAGNSGFWREQIPALADKARLILLDLPGHGQSDKPQAAYTMDFFASAVLAVMNNAGVDKAVLIGHSMGVPVISRVSAQAPGRVAALVAVDGMLRKPAVTAEQAGQFVGPFATPRYREHTTTFIGAMFPAPGTDKLRDEVLSEILATPQHVMLGAMEGMFSPNQPDWNLRKLEVPLLVLNAPNPSLWTPEYETFARSLSTQTDYRTLTGVGHWLMLEKPKEFNAALTDFLLKFNLIAK